MAEFQYRIKRKFAHKEQLITHYAGEVINLTGRAVTVKRAATKERPAFDDHIRGATQEDLEALFNLAGGNHTFIERVPVDTDPALPAKSNESDAGDKDPAGEKAPAGEAKAQSGSAAKAAAIK